VTSPEERLAYLSGAAIVLVGFSLLVGCKARHVKKLASGLARPRPLLPIGTTLRTLLAGPALTAGIALQLHADDPWWGTLLVLLAMTLTWYLPPAWLRRPRGPGRWLPLADHEAFAHPTLPEFAWLDASTRRGALALSLSLLALGALAVIAARTSSYGAYLVAFDAAVLLPLFGTGRRAELPPHPFASAGPRLRRVAEHLRKNAALRAIAWGRLPEGQGEFDELRLLASPKVPRRGFTGIEVGYVAMSGVGGALLLPEVLVRVIDASPCHDAFRALVPGSHWMRGRKPDERVVLLKPRLPTLTMTAELAAKLARCATDTAAPTVASLAKTKGACSDEQQRIAKIGESRKSLGQVGREARAHFES
ncbi:MAG TPA: hypothetical protein VJT73_11505, partial [Polyangiaceae bacterium]|nr:hypothetical protein [Polyangiaceae bacterium]